MIIKSYAANPVHAQSLPIQANARCPGCGQLGSFEIMHGDTLDFQLPNGYRIGQRRCPNMECNAHLFVVWHNNTIVRSYPALRIDFDTTNIPRSVTSAFEEAISCHANECFIAAAIMVRKTLEELCRDCGAQGKDLKERLRDLGTKIVLPKELLDGLDDLRLLGNDAAHIESREYDQVGNEEVEIGIEFTKEVLRATYQYSALLNRLRGLKKTP